MDFWDEMAVGSELDAYGKEWVQIQYLKEGFYLAVEKNAEFPARVFVIRAKPKKQTEDPKQKMAGD